MTLKNKPQTLMAANIFLVRVHAASALSRTFLRTTFFPSAGADHAAGSRRLDGALPLGAVVEHVPPKHSREIGLLGLRKRIIAVSTSDQEVGRRDRVESVGVQRLAAKHDVPNPLSIAGIA